MEGLNINSPIAQQMMYDHPELVRHASFCCGSLPSAQTECIVETGNGQSPQTVPIGPPRYVQTTTNPMVGQMVQQVQGQQPYADPYNMITGVGLAGYQMPTYNFTGALASPGYMDASQPVTGGAPMITIPGYSNPYMNNGFAVSGYDPRYVQPAMPGGYYAAGMMYQNPNRNPFEPAPMQPERQRRYMYGTDEDRIAIDRGFDSANHQIINNERIMSQAHVACMKYNGESEEAIQAYLEALEERHEMLRKEDEEFDKQLDPFNLDKYKNRPKDPDEMGPITMNVRIMKGDEVIVEMNGENGFKPTRTRDKAHDIMVGICMYRSWRAQIDQLHQYMHDHAIERQYDHAGIIEFFNVGFGHIHAVERQREWEAMAHDVTKLYDRNEFRARLHRNSTPQMRQKAYEASLKQTGEANNPQDQVFIPGGIPVPVNVNTDVIGQQPMADFVEEMPGVFYNEKSGVMNITLPDFLDDGSYDPSIYDKINGLSIPEAKAKRDAQRRRDFLNEVAKM